MNQNLGHYLNIFSHYIFRHENIRCIMIQFLNGFYERRPTQAFFKDQTLYLSVTLMHTDLPPAHGLGY